MGQELPSKVLAAALKSTDPKVRADALVKATDGETNPNEAAVLYPMAVGALADPAGEVRLDACLAVRRLAHKIPEDLKLLFSPLSALILLLDDSVPRVRARAANAIHAMASIEEHWVPEPKKLVSQATKAIGPLLANLQHPDSEVRWNAAEALGRISSPKPRADVVGALIAAVLDIERPFVRGHAVYALGFQGATAAVPHFIQILKDRKPKPKDVQETVIYALGLIAHSEPEAASTAVPEVARFLRHPKSGVRLIAAQTLGYIGPKASGAIAALKKQGAIDKDSEVRSYIRQALQLIAGKRPTRKDR